MYVVTTNLLLQSLPYNSVKYTVLPELCVCWTSIQLWMWILGMEKVLKVRRKPFELKTFITLIIIMHNISSTRYSRRSVTNSRVVYRTEYPCCNGYEKVGSNCERKYAEIFPSTYESTYHPIAAICRNCNHPWTCESPGVCVCSDVTGVACSDGEL